MDPQGLRGVRHSFARRRTLKRKNCLDPLKLQRAWMESLNMNTLASSLPNSANAEKQLMDNFKGRLLSAIHVDGYICV